MRNTCVPLALLVPLVLQACGGQDSPTAPTAGDPPEAPIVVTITANVVANAAQALRTFHEPPRIVENRNVHVTGSIQVTGGTAMVETTVTYTPDAPPGESQVPIELVALSLRSIAPIDLPVDFDVTVFAGGPRGTDTSGTVRVNVTGTDQRGGAIDELVELLVTHAITQTTPPACVSGPATLCLFDRFSVEVNGTDSAGSTAPGMVTSGQRGNNFGWFNFAGATAGMVDPNGFDLLILMTDECLAADRYTFQIDNRSGLDSEITFTDNDAPSESFFFMDAPSSQSGVVNFESPETDLCPDAF
jgi:hypothetical protein